MRFITNPSSIPASFRSSMNPREQPILASCCEGSARFWVKQIVSWLKCPRLPFTLRRSSESTLHGRIAASLKTFTSQGCECRGRNLEGTSLRPIRTSYESQNGARVLTRQPRSLTTMPYSSCQQHATDCVPNYCTWLGNTEGPHPWSC